MVTIKKKQKKGCTYSNNPVKGIGQINNDLYSNKEGNSKNNHVVFNTVEKKGQKEQHYQIKYIGKPVLKLDKFTLTYPVIDNEYQAYVFQTMLGLYNDDKNNKIKQLHDNLYRLTINIKIKKGRSICLSCNPYDSNNNYFRVSFNPYKLGKGKDKLKDLLNLLLPDGIDLYKANITRMDVAVDYTNIKPSDVMIKAKGFKVARIHCNGMGKIDTHYVGSEKSPLQYCVYDKTKEQKEKKYGKYKEQLSKYSEEQYTRVEARIKGNSIQELKELDPFNKLQIYWAPAPIGIKDYLWRFFLSDAQANGLQTALRQIPRQDRKPYQDRVAELICDWWSPENLLPEYKKQLHELVTFFEE